MTALSPETQAYLVEQRHLSTEIIVRAGLEQEGHSLVIPLKKGKKFRALDGAPEGSPKYKLEKGTTAQLYCRDWIDNEKEIVICEGEIDCLLLWQNGIPAVTSTAGALTWEDAWTKDLPDNIRCILCFDNDDAGDAGREKVRASILEHRRDISIADVKWGDVPKGYDVSDAYELCVKKNIDFKTVFMERVTEYLEPIEGEEGYLRAIPRLRKPSQEMDFLRWMSVIADEFPELTAASEICASVMGQLLIQEIHNCFALVLIDVPGSGKTICLNFFTGLEEISYCSDDFTPASFVSQVAGKKKSQLAEIDLLPRIRWKTLIAREMAGVFGDFDDALRKKLGNLTRVLDGEGWTTDSGTHGRRGYEGDYMFMFLGASTPIPLRVWKVMGGLGHRMQFVSLNTKAKDPDDLREILLRGNYKKREIRCKRATHDLFRTLWSRHPMGILPDASRHEQEAIDWITKMSKFLSHFRGEIIVFTERQGDGGYDIQHTRPMVEHATRVCQLFMNLAMGHAVLQERDYITMADIPVVARVMVDTAPDPRPQVLRGLINNGGTLTVKEVCDTLKCKDTKAMKEMEKFVALQMCTGDMEYDQASALPDMEDYGTGQKKKILELTEEFAWVGSKEFRDLLESF